MRALIALGLAVALSGCTGGDRVPAPSPTPTTTQPPLPPTTDARWRTGVFAELPLDHYVLSGAQAQAVLDANRLLTQRCMQAKGYTYLANRVVDPGQVFYAYGPTDPATVTVHGYSQPQLLAAAADQPRRGSTDQLLSLGYLQALLGARAPTTLGTLPDPGPGPVTAADGCTGQATLGLGPLPDPAALVGRLGHEAALRVPDDERVRQALDAWSACMDGAGRPFASPREALDFPWRSAPEGAEVATATADVACKAAADLPGTWQRVEAEAQAPLVAAHLAALAAVAERSRAQVLRARALLQAGG